MKRVTVLLGLFFLAFISATAQEPSPFTLSVSTQLTVRTVSVTDRDGNPIEGLSAEEVSEVIDLNVHTVKTRLHRARMAVRAQLAPLIDGAAGSTISAPC